MDTDISADPAATWMFFNYPTVMPVSNINWMCKAKVVSYRFNKEWEPLTNTETRVNQRYGCTVVTVDCIKR